LTLVSVISPLLGLLGTVFGLIQMFQAISDSQQTVTPALLADGLGVAMHTTAAGLLIALPALVGVHLLNSWIDHIIAVIEQEMNRYNLWLEGITLNEGCV
jgi:biopolymer transport protein ExbB